MPNRTTLRIRYQVTGRPLEESCGRRLIDLLLRQNDRAQNGDQDQHAGDFEGQQIRGEELAADVYAPCLP